MDPVKHLEIYRLENKLSQEELAQKLGVAFSTINRWFNHKSNPSKMQTYHIMKLVNSYSSERNMTVGQEKTVDIKNFMSKLIEGDCLEVMKKIPKSSVHMILCDLPYGTTQNKWDCLIPLEQLWAEYMRIIKDNGAIVLTSQGIFTARLILSNLGMFKYKIIWVKSKPTNFLNARRQPLRKHEDVCVFYKNQARYCPQMVIGEPYDKGVRKDQFTGSYGDFRPVRVKSNGERFPTDVVYFKTAESEGPVWHPTQKPVELGRYLIRTFTKPGDIIMDNAFGSGSFPVAAVLENRNFIGIEKNEEVHLFKKSRIDYIKVAEQRISEARSQLISDQLISKVIPQNSHPSQLPVPA